MTSWRSSDSTSDRLPGRGWRILVAATAGLVVLAHGSPAPADDLRRTGEVWRDLLEESGRAELDRGGPFIDFGTSDQHKYTRGGWRTGWGPSKRDGQATYAEAASARNVLTLLTSAPARAITVRLRAHSRAQNIQLALDGKALSPVLGSARIERSWRELSFVVPPDDGQPGRHRIELLFAEQRGSAADIDWLWMRTNAQADPPVAEVRVSAISFSGRPLRALLAPSPRVYSYYLHVPKSGALAFDYGSSTTTRFTVRARTMDGASQQLFTARAQPGAWRPASVDLSGYAGQAIRLELVTQGVSAQAAWGRLEVLVPRSGRRARRIARRDRPRNVVLVVYDTTRADVFGPFARRGAENAVATPRFDALARQSAVFARAYNNESWTRPSTISILTGLYPESHGALFARDILDSRVETLAEKLKRHGFQTFGIVGNGVLRAEFGLGQGWDDYRNYGQLDNTAKRIFGEAGQWIADNHAKRPFLVYIQSHDSHTPYQVERPYSERYHKQPYRGYLGQAVSGEEQEAINSGKRRVRTSDMDWMRALYYGEATYQDQYFGQLIDKLAALGILDDTLIVVTNDHGEELRDHGKLGHLWTLYEELLRAPLIMRHPKLFPANRRVDEVVEHVDVAPTIVDALGLPPMKHADGLSLMSLFSKRRSRPRPYYAVSALRTKKRAVHVGRWKLIVERDAGWEGLYNLTRDPGERRNRIADRPLAGRLCEVYLGEALAAPTKARRMSDMTVKRHYRATKAKLDAGTRRELEALGYLGTESMLEEDSGK